MKKESFNVKSSSDGLELYTTLFIPDKNIKGIIQFVHGMVEHQIYYYTMMEYFTNKGYVTIINDLRGHGKSIKESHDLGYFYEQSATYIVEDIHDITNYIKGRFPNTPLYLFGHSMGSLIVRKYIKNYDYEIDKLIVCGSPSINTMSKPGLMLSKLVKLFKGERYRSRFLNGLALTNDVSLNWLSTDEEYFDKYRKDKNCRFIFTANGFINLTKLMCDVYSKKGWILSNKDLDILFIAGSEDIVIKNTNLFIKSVNFLNKVGYKNIDYKLYEGCKHAIFYCNPRDVYKDILKFIESK